MPTYSGVRVITLITIQNKPFVWIFFLKYFALKYYPNLVSMPQQEKELRPKKKNKKWKSKKKKSSLTL
jgi:hypothetical protein